MPRTPVWERLRDARIPRVLALYLGAAWVVLQVTVDLGTALGLPQWVAPLVVLLLAVGLVIVAITAWILAHPAQQERARAEEVPGSWELDLSDVVKNVSRGRLPRPTWARVLAGGVLVFTILLGSLLAYATLREDAEDPNAAPALAVVPFDVAGPGMELWREGMVDLLTTNLDGLSGLRTISSRTVLARWRQRVGDGASPELDTTLQFVRSTGARYALLGAATATGRGMRLSARLYDVRNAKQLGSATVDGPADSIFALVDRISIELLSSLARRGDLETGLPGLESVTTSSVPALKSYLEGKALVRRSDFARSEPLFQQAVALDSTFALAWVGLASAYGWQNLDDEKSQAAAEQAARHVGRLPPRDAALVRLRGAVTRGDHTMIPEARALVRTYPDDPEIWMELAELIWHFGHNGLVDQQEALPAFERAIALDPSFSSYHIHPVEQALREGNLAEARMKISRYASLVSADEVYRRAFDVSLAALTEPPPTVEAVADTADLDMLSYAMIRLARSPDIYYGGTGDYAPAAHHALLALSTRIARRDHRYRDPVGAMMNGRVARARELTADWPPQLPWLAALYYRLHRTGHPLPGDEVATRLEASAQDSVFDRRRRNLVAAAHAAETGRWPAFAAAQRNAQAVVERALTVGDTAVIREAQAFRVAIDAYGQARRGELAAAVPRLEQVLDQTAGRSGASGLNDTVRWWLAELHEEQGQYTTSLRYYRTFAAEPYAQLAMARIHERLGALDEARQAYALAAEVWKHADPGFPPAAEAIEALARLTAETASGRR